MFKKRNYRKRVSKRRSVVGRRRSSVSVAVKKYVKSTISRNVEDKRNSSENSFAIGSVSNSSTLYARPVTPAGGFMTIAQGTGQGDRIGNVIKTKKCILRYALFPVPYDITVNPNPAPVEVLIILGYLKVTPCSTPTSAGIQQLYQIGNTTIGAQGDLGDLINPFNTDVWVIKKTMRHKIGYADNSGTGSRNGSQFYANNDFKLNVVRSVDITSIYPSKFVFQDTQTIPQNAGLFLMVQAINADGTTSNAANTKAFFEYTVDYHYEDA